MSSGRTVRSQIQSEAELVAHYQALLGRIDALVAADGAELDDCISELLVGLTEDASEDCYDSINGAVVHTIEVRELAAGALAKIGPRVVPQVAGMLSPYLDGHTLVAVFRVLKRLAPHAGPFADEVLAFCAHPDRTVRWWAAMTMGGMPPAVVLPRVRQSLGAEETRLQGLAIAEYAPKGGRPWSAPLASELVELLQEPELAAAAAWALAPLVRCAGVAEALLAKVSDRQASESLRSTCLKALDEVGKEDKSTRRAVAAVALESGPDGLRKIAARSLRAWSKALPKDRRLERDVRAAWLAVFEREPSVPT